FSSRRRHTRSKRDWSSDVCSSDLSALQPGEEKVIEFKVDQKAATLWFHPHPDGQTSEQVYNGLAGLIYIEDENSKSLGLPNEYAQNEIPLMFQDRDRKSTRLNSSHVSMAYAVFC